MEAHNSPAPLKVASVPFRVSTRSRSFESASLQTRIAGVSFMGAFSQAAVTRRHSGRPGRRSPEEGQVRRKVPRGALDQGRPAAADYAKARSSYQA